jgi:hypothetical protein
VVPGDLRPGVYSLGLRVAWWRHGTATTAGGAPPGPRIGPRDPAVSEPDDPRLRDQAMIVPLGSITVTRAARR